MMMTRPSTHNLVLTDTPSIVIAPRITQISPREILQDQKEPMTQGWDLRVVKARVIVKVIVKVTVKVKVTITVKESRAITTGSLLLNIGKGR
mmetsp:Transcript_13572/g.47171  ORF Transcript_13572/g.47171 Transcript_13572/m.47171 type:complete len:92 (+) Transcript_13572:231-506(+)